MLTRKDGFTLTEIMIVTAVIGLIAAIAIPNFLRAKQETSEKACLANIKQIQNGLEVAALVENAAIENLSEAQIEALLVPDYLKKMPDCAYGDYSTDADGNAGCSYHSGGGGDDGGDGGAAPFI